MGVWGGAIEQPVSINRFQAGTVDERAAGVRGAWSEGWSEGWSGVEGVERGAERGAERGTKADGVLGSEEGRSNALQMGKCTKMW